MAEQFRADPEYAVEFINSVLQDGDAGELLVALRQLSMAQGGLATLAKRAHMNRTQAYRILSKNGKPGFENVFAVLRGLNLQIAVAPRSDEPQQAQPARQLQSA